MQCPKNRKPAHRRKPIKHSEDGTQHNEGGAFSVRIDTGFIAWLDPAIHPFHKIVCEGDGPGVKPAGDTCDERLLDQASSKMLRNALQPGPVR